MKILGFLKRGTARIVFIFLAVMLLVMAVWVYQSSAAFIVKAQDAKDNNIRLVGVAQQMRVDVIQIQQWLTDISATRAKDGLDDGFLEAEKSYQSFVSGLDVFEQFYVDNDNDMLEQVRDLRAGVDLYYGIGKQMAQAYIEGGPAGGNKVMAHFDDAASGLYDALNPFVDGQTSALSGAMADIVDSASMLKMVTMVVFSTVFLVTFVGLFVQNRNNQQQMEKIIIAMETAAEGDLTVNMHEDSGQLASVSLAINDLLGRFAQMILKVKENADFVYTGAEQISEGNDNLSRRLQEQATSLEETASSMEEMTSTVKHNADSASEANKLVNNTREEAEKGGQIVQKAVSAMQDINDSSDRIADIIGTIESIAFQTNLLALNAAVEAARAGEQGRGFAVVASEVRVLAQRSADAAKEIKGLIDDSVAKVKTGTEQVDESGKTLLGIISSIKKVDELMTEINNASQEQSSGIDEVNIAVAHIDDRIQQNAAFVEQSSAASNRMRDQAAVLNKIISYFKLNDSNDREVTQQSTPPQLSREI